MSFKEIYHNRWVRFIFWTVLYLLWTIWHGNYWWLFGLIVVFDMNITKRVKWAFWKKNYKVGEKRNALLDWLDAIIFAVIVVTFINTFFFQSFTIPSSSMESSLMTGDYLFVEKLTFGPRMPKTPISMPFMHNVTPGGKKCYWEGWQCDYKRLSGFRALEAGDCVVFNFPHGDTVLTKAPAEDYYAHVRFNGRAYTEATYGPLMTHPSDKTDHYVKRCVAAAGDTLEVKDGLVWVNGVQQEVYEGVQLTYKVITDGSAINRQTIDRLGISMSDLWYARELPGYPAMALTATALKEVSKLKNVVSIEPNIDVYPSDEPYQLLFPFTDCGWTRDNYGPIWIPSKGSSVVIDSTNVELYRRIITHYEGSDLVMDKSYTFKQDYYFMMGDNRHNSLDSRYWGFVPEEYIVGKPAFIWFSKDASQRFPKSIRWKRLGKVASTI